MPELPDLTVYIEHIANRIQGCALQKVRIGSVFLLRTYKPPITAVHGKKVLGVKRIGKHIVLQMEESLNLVFHLMVAGRFHWRDYGLPLPKKVGLAALDFENGTLLLTETGSKRRASLHVVFGDNGLLVFDRGGIELFETCLDGFTEVLLKEKHTLKRTLTDPRLIAGVGNAYSDEILHQAKLSPLKYSTALTKQEIRRLYNACREVLSDWIDRLRKRTGDGFPEKVTAFQDGMAVHGRFGKPCPVCGAPIQRIVYVENECNYCPGCQTGGKVLADRSLSRILKGEWPRTLKQLEELPATRRVSKTL